MNRTRLVIATLGCISLVSGQATAVQAKKRAAPPPYLAGTTTVTATTSASMAVRLSKAVTIDSFADITLNGRGRIYGVVLHQDGGPDKPTAGKLNHGFCAGAGCTPELGTLGEVPFFDPPGAGFGVGTLPPGNYHLYLLADGAPVQVTLRLAGLTGSLSLAPKLAAKAALGEPAPTTAEPATGPSVFSAGSTHTVPAAGGFQAFTAWKAEPLANEFSHIGDCIYPGAPPAGPFPAYQEPCHGGDGAVSFGLTGSAQSGTAPTPAGPGRFISYYMAGYFLDPATIGIGAFMNTPGPVTSAAFQQLWLDYDM
jgi:hypothetical protein